MRSALALLGLATLLAAPSFSQSIVSAKAGLIHFSDGRVLLNEKPIVYKVAQYQDVKEQDYLKTERGRAEVLLTPGVFLRLGEDSDMQMLSTKLNDVRFRLLTGSAVIEADEIGKENQVRVLISDVVVRLERAGLYHFDVLQGEEPRLRVFSGEAVVMAPNGTEYRLKGKKEIELAGNFAIQKFDPEDTDALDRWSKRRASYLAQANISASRLAYNRGYAFSGSQWIWSPFYGMYTFLPYRNIAWSPYGYGFYSPRAVIVAYTPRPRMDAGGGGIGAPSSRGYNSNYGYTSVGATSAGTSGVMASSPSSPAAQGGGASVSRGSATSGGGGRR